MHIHMFPDCENPSASPSLPQGQEKAVPHYHPNDPHNSQPQADVVEVDISPCEEIPGDQFFRGKPLCDFIFHNGLKPFSAEVEYVREFKFYSMQMLNFFFHRCFVSFNDTLGKKG